MTAHRGKVRRPITEHRPIGRAKVGPRASMPQRAAVMNYLDGGRWTLVAEFTEVGTARTCRPRRSSPRCSGLPQEHKATLVIAKLDRLSRNSGVHRRR